MAITGMRQCSDRGLRKAGESVLRGEGQPSTGREVKEVEEDKHRDGNGDRKSLD